MYSPTGVVFGAGYTDINARLHSYYIMSLISLILGALIIVSLCRKRLNLIVYGLITSIAIFLISTKLYPFVQQKYWVESSERAREMPYIAHNIKATHHGYALDKIEASNYIVENKIDTKVLQENQLTIENLPLWNNQTLLTNYRQRQEIKRYYKFRDIDVDRYTIDGDYHQVMLAPRELDYSQLPQKSWISQHLIYTHGYGLAMSPVNQVTSKGSPEFLIQDIPVISHPNLQINQPAIYYGEETNSYIFTGTKTEEFNYPRDSDNITTQYQGKGGVVIPSILHRLAYAYNFKDLKMITSQEFTNKSRIHYYRNIQERVKKVAPFLRYDSNPYITAINGKLKWIIDAYTVSDRYPYSQDTFLPNNSESVSQTNESQTPLEQNNSGNNVQENLKNVKETLQRRINYIRNSVKVLVDAYDGTMQFFVIDDQDPVLRTYQKIYPNLFIPNETIPEEVKTHFCYPLDLFKLQAQMYLTYHVEDSKVFYNKGDEWNFPIKKNKEGKEEVLEPYYAIMRLPKQTKEEFVLISPFTPINKNNMIAWMAVSSDGENYGKFSLYKFSSKQKQIYGPQQIDNRINQNSEISSQITLLDAKGSQVIRGDVLVIPLEQSLLYMQPLYLEAEKGGLPELKRVIVAYKEEIVTEDSLEKALKTIFSDSKPQQNQINIPTQETPSVTAANLQLIQSALETYQKSQEALTQGDWASYGQYQKELGEILQQLLLSR